MSSPQESQDLEVQFNEAPEMRPLEIVLTGGPCAGKTTAMAVLSQKLADYGYRVLVCPETAALIINAGVDVIGLAGSPSRYIELQRHVVRTQRALRQQFRELASLYDEPVIILFDRGEMDNSAYVEPALYAALLEEERLTLGDVRDSYDMVIHLVSAAEGAVHAYTLANNIARSETPEQARELDRRTLNAWIGHPHLRIIDNSTDFDTKMNRVLRAVTQLLGKPAPLEIERKFLVRGPADVALLEREYGAQAVTIEQTYLISGRVGVEVRVRKRTQGSWSAYYRTEKVTLSPGHRYERERTISALEYQNLLGDRNVGRATIQKTRYCFAHAGLYFELDHIHTPLEMWLLEVELTEDSTEVHMPDGIVIDREVTQEREYSNAEIARTGVR